MLLLGTISSLYAQKTYTYSGKVVDADGATIPGVNVVIKGTTVGTSTDLNGTYKITSTKPTETLVFSYVGSVTQEVKVLPDLPLTVTMQSKTIGLQELVVIGYGTQKKSVVTGAITSVKSKDLENAPITRVEQALQGRTSGMTITTSSGQPGASATVRVRGTTTINNSDPLYIVDGMAVDVGGIDYLNTADIESIEVLKDGASAAIYGTRAANGVILITTKKGKAGKMQVNYNAYIGTQSPAKKLDLCNATEYATLRNEALVNAGKPAYFTDVESLGAGTDWQDAIFNKNAGIQNHELSVSGGNDRSTYYFSLGYMDQEGVILSSISNYKRLNVRFNSTHKVNKWLTFGNNLGYSHIKSQGSLNTNSEYGGPLASAVNLDPTTPILVTQDNIEREALYTQNAAIKNDDGQYYFIDTIVQQEMTNPLAYEKTVQGNYGWSDNIVGNIYAEVEPIKGLKIKSDIGTKLAFWGDVSFTPIYYLSPTSNRSNTSFYKANNQGLSWNWENTASYTRSFGKHNITGLLGTSALVSSSSGLNVAYSYLPVSTFEEASMNYSLAAENRLGSGWESADYKLASMFARLTYNYSEKYLFTGIIRRDGSSKFGRNNKYGYFPSASVGWVASQEDFWPKNKVVTFLKVRASYGVTGNDRISDFAYLSLVSGGRNYTFGDDVVLIGNSPDAPANPDLRWEQTSQTNIGFDASLFEDFSMTFELYNKNTTGMLFDLIIPNFLGANGNPKGNVCSMTNKGAELELGYRKQIRDLYIDVKANTSYLKNEVTDLGSVEYTTGATFQASSYELTRTAVGQPIGSFYGFEVLGIFQDQAEVNGYHDENGNKIQPNAKPGDFKFADLNGDGKITADDRTYIGDPTPTWSFGFNATARYKNFDLMVFGQGVAGNDVYNALRRLDISSANWTTDALDRWTGEGTAGTYPRLVTGDPNGNFSKPSSFYLTDGSYFRIKIVQIGYAIPKAVLSKIGMDNLRFYVSGNNLVTFTKYNGFDPEIGGGSYGIDRGVYPQARSFMLGVNVAF
jgi:TonB-linked SusC/RagA family outer membrane protein